MKKLKSNAYLLVVISLFSLMTTVQAHKLINLSDSTSLLIKQKNIKTWKDSFLFVRDHIQFEPSKNIIKSNKGVLWGRRGNAREQSMVLASFLRDKDEKIRFAYGKLDNTQAAILIASLFPKKKEFPYAKEIPVSNPANNKNLIKAVRHHCWVQIYKNNQWIDLDPSFPEAEFGKAHASVIETFSQISREVLPKLTISLFTEKGEYNENKAFKTEAQNILQWRSSIKEISNKPVSLTILADFKKVKEQKSGGGFGSVFGGISGGSTKKKDGKAEELEVLYKVVMKINGQQVEKGKFSHIIPASSEKKIEGKQITKVWLKFNMEDSSGKSLESKRILYEKLDIDDSIPLFQRHSILISGNSIPAEAWQEELDKVSNKKLSDGIKSAVEDIKKELKTKKDKRDVLKKSISLEKKMGPEIGHILNMILCYVSDDLNKKAEEALSVYSYFYAPRIIITSFQGENEKIEIYLDLRMDSIKAIPYPGQALAMKSTFLFGRGVMESILEGKLVSLFSGREALSTASIMNQANNKNIPIRMYSKLEKESIASMNMSEHVRKKIIATLESGKIVMLPDENIEFQGKSRWGWWEVEPESGETIGVLDTGLHQALLQRTILETDGILNSKMGNIIGVLTGVTNTYWLLSAKILEYGELNKQALEEAKKFMKNTGKLLCPGLDKTVSKKATVIEDCYEKTVFEAGVKLEMGWCQAFSKGFNCASTTILNYYLSKYE